MQVDAQLLPAPVVVDTKLKPAEMLAPLSQASEPSELPPPLPNVSGLVCPLCHEMLEDPVMAVDGHTYCRRCIQDWFQQTEAGSKPKSPVTGQPLLSLLLFPNLALGKALISIRTNMQPAWLQAEKERQALRAELDLKTRELIQAKAQSSGKDYSKDLTEAELNVAQLTAKLQIADEETRAGRGEVERLNKELGGLREKLERTQAQISGERSAMQQIDELDSLLRFSKAEVTRLQTELESVKKQETELRRGKYRYEIDMAKVTQENQKNQEELVRLRFQTQSQEGIPSSVVLAETLDTAKKDLEAKDTVIRELQLAGTRAGAQLVDLMEKQRQSEILLRRVPELEAENHALRQELNGKVAELSALKETLLQTEEKLRLREAAPELTAAELLASEAERLKEELAFAHDQLANWQVEFKKREDLLRGIPLVFADFLAQINAPDSALSSSNLRPEDAPRFVIAALQRLQLTMVKREEELKFAHEKIAELSQYAGSQGMSGSFIAKMAMLMYLLEVSVLSGSGLRDAKWKPSSNGAGLSCTVEIPGKEDKLVTKSIHTTKDPVWNHTGELQMSHSDSLCFTVQGEQKIGQAVLPASRAVVAGFEGDLKLNATETGLENAMIKSYHPATPLVARSKQAALRLPLVVCLLCLNYGGDGFSTTTLATSTTSAGLGTREQKMTLSLSKDGTNVQKEGSRYLLWCGLLLTGSALGALHCRRTARAAKAMPQSSKSYALAMSRFQILGICCILAAQYTMLLIFGVYGSELLDPGDANKLYAAASWGACFLAAPAGVCFDALGPAWSTLLGGAMSAFGLGTAALVLGSYGAASLLVASVGYLLFGFGTTLLNTVGLLAAVRVVPSQHSGKAAACVLCSAALGISFHTAVHAKWCRGAPFHFINYQITYSILSAVIGFMIFRSQSWKLALAEVEEQEADGKSSGEASPQSQSSSTRGRIFGILKNKDFPWLAAIYLIPIAYCFAWLGNWPVCATSLGLPAEAQTRIGLSVGLFSALGRVVFGLLGDWVPKGRGLVGLELGFTASLGLFAGSFLLLCIDQRMFFEAAMRLQSLGYGGVLCLAAVALRASFSGEDLGTAFGFLYQILTVTFMLFNWACVPSSNCEGAECFKGFFNLSGVLHVGCVLWGVRRLLRASKRAALETKSP